MLQAEKEKFIDDIFSKKELFEKHILNIHGNDDRIEVMDILSKRIIRTQLREELNFLYMKNLDSFKFSLIVNILFREIANEWVTFAQERLAIEQEEALNIIQDKRRVVFMVSLVKEYFRHYKIYFVQEIADTFIELIETMPSPSFSNELIDTVLASDFIKQDKIAVIYNYGQLWSRVRHAHGFKNDKLTKLQIQISESHDTGELKKYEHREALLEEKPLAFFDEAILRLRNTMVQYMMHIDSFHK